MYCQLILKIFKEINSVAGIKIFIVLAMRPFYFFAVVTRRIGAYFVVGNAIGLQPLFKQRQVRATLIAEVLYKFRTVICLNF